MQFTIAAAVAVAVFVVDLNGAAAQFASSIVLYQPGNTQGGGLFVPSVALGGPQGLGVAAGSQDVLTLGEGGSLTLGFGVTLTDGPGADFIVCENAFFAVTTVYSSFAEAVFVEVSSNGSDFARFASSYAGPILSPGPFGTFTAGSHAGLAGVTPVIANVAAGIGDPFDAATAGGDAFDLADLASDPLVLSGALDLAAVHFVRLVDVIGGVAVDSSGQTIHDSGAPGSADIDAVIVLNSTTSTTPGQPQVAVHYDGAGFLRLVLGDPNGLGDLDPASFRATFGLTDVPAAQVLAFFPNFLVTATAIEFVSVVPVQGQGVQGVLGFSIADLNGRRTSVQFKIQG